MPTMQFPRIPTRLQRVIRTVLEAEKLQVRIPTRQTATANIRFKPATRNRLQVLADREQMTYDETIAFLLATYEGLEAALEAEEDQEHRLEIAS